MLCACLLCGEGGGTIDQLIVHARSRLGTGLRLEKMSQTAHLLHQRPFGNVEELVGIQHRVRWLCKLRQKRGAAEDASTSNSKSG